MLHDLAGYSLAEWEAASLDWRIRYALSRYLAGGYRYPRHGETQSQPWDGGPLSYQRVGGVIACSPMTATILCAAYPSAGLAYARLSLHDRPGLRLDDPIREVDRVEVGWEVEGYDVPGWYLWQKWDRVVMPETPVKDAGGGHAMLVHYHRDRRWTVIQSSSLNGVGPRLDLRDTPPQAATVYLARLRE